MGKLFQTKKEREQEERRDRRRAFRQAEASIDEAREKIRRMDKESQKVWQQARESLKAGQKAAAQRHMTSYRASQVMMMKLEQKRWLFEQMLTKMQMAGTDMEFAGALAKLTSVVKISVDKVEDVFDAATELLDEQVEVDKFWETHHRKEMEGAEFKLDDQIPGLEEMMKDLEQEAAAEAGGAGLKNATGALGERVSQGRERVSKLLDGK